MAIFLSASLLREYVQCNRMVFYRTNRPETATQSKEMIIGEIVHKAIELYWNNEVLSQGYVFGRMKEQLPNEPVTYASHCLRNFHSYFQEMLSEYDDIELQFKIPYEKGVYIVGKMDRITPVGNVIDWKTDRNPATNISSDIQFILYNWAYGKLYGKKPASVYYAALGNGSLVQLNYDKVKEDILVNEIIPLAIRDIKSKNFTRTGIFRKACYRCNYANPCLTDIGGKNVLDNRDITDT